MNRKRHTNVCTGTLSFVIMTTSDTNKKEKIKMISDNRTNGRKTTGLSLPHSHSCITHTNLSHHVIEGSALYCCTWRCPSHITIFKVPLLRKQIALGHMFYEVFLFLFWSENTNIKYGRIFWKYLVLFAKKCAWQTLFISVLQE